MCSSIISISRIVGTSWSGVTGINRRQRLLVWTDRRFVLRLHFIAFSPLPVVVAVVVDFLDCDRRFRRDVVRKIVRSLVDLVGI